MESGGREDGERGGIMGEVVGLRAQRNVYMETKTVVKANGDGREGSLVPIVGSAWSL